MTAETRPARALMQEFAAATGLEGDAPQRRYLWTDAFAVCNWIGMGEVDRARALVDRVHQSLARHRDDDPRQGWISGLDEAEGARHPTAGGLRIGKPMPERRPEEPYDPQLEWERDGQYFHYLTRWMRALLRMAEATGEPRYHRWASELARVAFDRFSHGIGPVPNRLYWKMSIDLSRPLVPSMGQHDPLDGYVVTSRISATDGGAADAIRLDDALDGLLGMGEGSDLATDDPLGAGSLLGDAWLLASLPGVEPERGRILTRVVKAAATSLREIADTRLFDLPAVRRLAFRELGLAIGLAAVEPLRAALHARPELAPDAEDQVAELRRSLPLRDRILEVWLNPATRRTPGWIEHRDINTVMLATAIDPRGYLGLRSRQAPRGGAEPEAGC